LNLGTILSKKNPYLFRASGIAYAPELINELLAAHISSSDESIFGSSFFEPVFRAVSGARTAAAKGTDFVIETDDTFTIISLKSGPNALNSSQVAGQNREFENIERSLRATLRNLRKAFIPIMGCGYGRANSEATSARKYAKLAGQSFWEHITGDADFYIKLVRLMRDDPARHRLDFEAAWNRAANRFLRDFLPEFCDDTGNILWEKLVQFNSGRDRPEGMQGGRRRRSAK